MKTHLEIQETLKRFEQKYGMTVGDAAQGSDAWFKLKLGVISASDASKVVAKKDSDTRHTYMCSLVSQVCTGVMEELNSKYLDWGNQNEDAARSSYEFEKDTLVTKIPFVFKDDSHRAGCSPDALVTETKGLEIKCPYNSENYIKFLVDGHIKPEYVWQSQFTLWVLDAEEWDFMQFDPRMRKSPSHIVTVKRDAEKQAKFDDLIPAFIEDMDKMLAKIGVNFGSQWS